MMKWISKIPLESIIDIEGKLNPAKIKSDLIT